MKKYIVWLSLAVAALVAVPTVTRAEDKPATTAPAIRKPALFSGKVTAVDPVAETVTVDKMVLHITSETKIVKHGKRATLAEITVGEKVSGVYENKDDKSNAIRIRIGEKVKPENAAKPAEKAR